MADRMQKEEGKVGYRSKDTSSHILDKQRPKTVTEADGKRNIT